MYVGPVWIIVSVYPTHLFLFTVSIWITSSVLSELEFVKKRERKTCPPHCFILYFACAHIAAVYVALVIFFLVGGGSRVNLCAWLGMGFFKSTATCPHVCMSANVIYYLLQRPKLKKDRREGGGKTEGPYSYRQALPLPCRNRTLLW